MFQARGSEFQADLELVFGFLVVEAAGTDSSGIQKKHDLGLPYPRRQCVYWQLQ